MEEVEIDGGFGMFKVQMSDPLFDNVALAIMASYPNACILWVHRIVNKGLEAAFIRRVQETKELRGDVETKQLFHGTSRDNIEPIARDGFDKGLNKRSLYGKGTYLATTSALGMRYSQPDRPSGVSYILVCKAAIGACVEGRVNAPVDVEKFDNAVNCLAKPTMYIMPHNDAVLPEFAVAFHANAN